MMVQPRLVAHGTPSRLRNSVLATNAALVVIVAALCWLIGWEDFLIVSAPAGLLAGSVGIWLFYVQHQFEDAYWQRHGEWSYAEAALRGSSYMKLPKLLQFFTGNIGLHHVHHLNPRIPNYNLQRAHDANAIFANVPTVSVRGGLRAVKFKLWDEDAGRSDIRPSRPPPTTGAQLISLSISSMTYATKARGSRRAASARPMPSSWHGSWHRSGRGQTRLAPSSLQRRGRRHLRPQGPRVRVHGQPRIGRASLGPPS